MVPMLMVCCGLVAQTSQPGQTPSAGPAGPASQPAPALPAEPAAGVKRLGLRDALQTALKYNLQVDIAQQTREQTRAQTPIALGQFDWNFSANAQDQRLDNSSTAPAGLNQAQEVVFQTSTSYSRSLTADLNRAFEWGGNLDLKYYPSYVYSKGTYYDYPAPGTNFPWHTYYPYTGAFTATYNQSLLQGFGTEVTTAQLVIARKNAAAADFNFEGSIIGLLSQVETDYWAVVYTQKDLDNKRISLRLAQQQLDENMIRLKVGTMAPLDVTQAEAQVAQAEQNIISSEANLANAKDTLVRDLYPNAERPAGLELTDAPTLSHTQLAEDGAVKMAMERRVELRAARIGVEVSQLQLTVAQDKVRPQLNVMAQYNGAANTYNSIGPVNTDLGGAKYPGYTLGLTFAVPIQNNIARGGLSLARANLRGTELNLRNQELTITLQVRQAVRNIDATEKGVKAAEKTRYLQEKTLEAEQKKFENGMSTNFNVLQDMTNLDAARAAEVQAQINYAQAVTALEVAVGDLIEARHFTIK
jgi:outer membrane protein TolC